MRKKFRLFFLLPLGFASGLPLLLTSSTLQAWYTQAGYPTFKIGLLTLLGQPYLFKFLWAPLFDRYQLSILGRRRGWILLFQLLLVFGIIAMAYLSAAKQPLLLAICALFVAFCSASQDIVLDAYRTDLLSAKERGLGTAWFIGGYRLGLLLAGGLALWFADYWGWHFTYLLMAGLLLFGVICTVLAPEPAGESIVPGNMVNAYIAPLKELVQRKQIITLLLLIILYKLGDALGNALTPIFLLRGLHFSLSEVGLMNKGLGVAAALAGTAIAGLLLLRISLWRALMMFGILQTCVFFIFIALAHWGKSYYVLALAIGSENMIAGMATTALTVWLMGLCDHHYSAAQFAFLSAIASLPRILAGPGAGIIINYTHWEGFYWFVLISCIPSLIWLYRLRNNFNLWQREEDETVVNRKK